MTSADNARLEAAFGGLVHDPALVARLDRALLRMRRAVVRPPTAQVPIPAIGRTVDVAKVAACLSIGDLEALDDPTVPVSVKDVAAALSLEHSTASRLLAETETEGLISRRTDPDDRRRTVVHLTDTGRAVVAQSVSIRTWVMDAFLADWTSEELRDFAELVEKFSASIEARSEDVLAGALARVHDAG